jgi:hypothetical protein
VLSRGAHCHDSFARPRLPPLLTFVPLHLKSAYSLGDGTASIEELIEQAPALAHGSLALTDLESRYGQVIIGGAGLLPSAIFFCILRMLSSRAFRAEFTRRGAWRWVDSCRN